MPLAEAITLIWPHGQVVLHQGDGRLQACQPVAAFSPGTVHGGHLHELFQDHLPPASANPPPTTQGAATSSLHRGCSRLTGKADPLPSSGSGSGPQEERPIWSKMTLQTSGKLPQRPSEPPMTPAAAAMLPTLLQDITVLLERQCGFH